MQTLVKLPTLADYQAAFAAQPVEVVDGEFVPMTPQGRFQPTVVSNLTQSFGNYVWDHELGQVLVEASYVLDADRRKDWVRGARTPDLSFIRRERVEAHNVEYTNSDEPWWLAPDLAAEVISHTDTYDDLSQKVADYLRSGVHIVWMIDPRRRTVRVHTPDQPTGFTLHDSDTLTAEPPVTGWSMAVAELFAGQ
jgi:Uma2 family endonuclease